MNELQIFNNPEFGSVRGVELNGEPWIVGKDVAAALGYERPTKAISDHVDEDDRMMMDGKTQSQFGIELGQRGGWLINESGLYNLVLSSKLPGAKKFKRWVTSEVLPSIRKHGGYIAGQETMTGEELMARAVLFAQSKIAELESKNQELIAKIEIDAPAVAFAQDVGHSKGAVTVDQFAKMLYDKHGMNIGQNRLFKFLRQMKILRENNVPYQKYMDMGWFRVRQTLKNGKLFPQTLIRGVGQQKLYEIIKENYPTGGIVK